MLLNEKERDTNVSNNRCLYCGRYGQQMDSNKCRECVKELEEVKIKIVRRNNKNIMPFSDFNRMLAK